MTVALRKLGSNEDLELADKEYAALVAARTGGHPSLLHSTGGRGAKTNARIALKGGPVKATAKASGGHAKKSAPKKAGEKVQLLFLKKTCLVAKLNRTKTHEGRLLDGRTRHIVQSSSLLYMCGKVCPFRVQADPVYHTTVSEGIASVGWESLMPWATSADDCLRQYAELFSKTKMTLAEARRWDAGPHPAFVTWPDTPQQVAKDSTTLSVRGYDLGSAKGYLACTRTHT